MWKRWGLGLAVVVVLALGVGGWLWTASRTASAVTVSWVDNGPSCSGTEVVPASHPGRPSPVIVAKRGMNCIITVEVVNDSGRSVRLDRVLMPLQGPGGGGVTRAASFDGEDLDDEGNDIDASVGLDRELEAGDTARFDIEIVFRPSGCNNGGTLSVYDFPVMTLRTLGRSFDIRPDNDFVYRRDGPTPGCRRM